MVSSGSNSSGSMPPAATRLGVEMAACGVSALTATPCPSHSLAAATVSRLSAAFEAPYWKPALAGQVVGNGGPGGSSAGERGEVQDPAASALAHAGNDTLHQLPRRPEIHLQAAFERLGRGLIERHVAVHGRVVHEDVDGPEFGLGTGDELASAAGRIGQVALQHQAFAADAPRCARRVSCRPGQRACGDRHRRTFRGQPDRDRRTGAALAGTGDERDLTRAGSAGTSCR